MAQYKTVAGPVGLTIAKNDSYTAAVNQYADIIRRIDLCRGNDCAGDRIVYMVRLPY